MDNIDDTTSKYGPQNPRKLKQTIIDLATEEEKKTRDGLWITKMQMSIIPLYLRPNYFTFFRFFLVALSAFLYIRNPEINYIQWIIIMVAAWSDAIDGSLARTRHQITASGTFLDPLADNMLIFWIFWMLIKEVTLNYTLGMIIIIAQIILMLCAGIMIMRKFFILKKDSAGAQQIDILRKSVLEEISVSIIGRLHFATLVISVVFLMFAATIEKVIISELLWRASLPMVGGGFALFFLAEQENYKNLGKFLVGVGIIFITISQLEKFAFYIGNIFLWISIVILAFEFAGYIINKNFLPRKYLK